MREQITFFDFFESFVPPRELRLLFHDAVVTGGALDVKQRALELDVATGERIPEAAQTALEQLEEAEKYGMILRAKGIVAGADGKWIHFDYVPGTPDVRTGSASTTGRLCVIGSHIQEDALAALFRTC